MVRGVPGALCIADFTKRWLALLPSSSDVICLDGFSVSEHIAAILFKNCRDQEDGPSQAPRPGTPLRSKSVEPAYPPNRTYKFSETRFMEVHAEDRGGEGDLEGEAGNDVAFDDADEDPSLRPSQGKQQRKQARVQAMLRRCKCLDLELESSSSSITLLSLNAPLSYRNAREADASAGSSLITGGSAGPAILESIFVTDAAGHVETSSNFGRFYMEQCGGPPGTKEAFLDSLNDEEYEAAIRQLDIMQDMPCLSLRLKGRCKLGLECPFSHQLLRSSSAIGECKDEVHEVSGVGSVLLCGACHGLSHPEKFCPHKDIDLKSQDQEYANIQMEG